MGEKKPNINIEIKASIADSETGEAIAPKEKPASPFFKVPWGWTCIAFITLLILDVEYGKLILSPSVRDQVGEIAVWGAFLSFVFFIWKLMDKDGREGSCGGCGYSYLGM